MSGISLKHYHAYMERLKAYAEAVGLDIKYGDLDGEDGYFSPHRRYIKIDNDLSESYEIAIILHELGHSLDDTVADMKTESEADTAYSAMYRDKATKKQNKIVIACEKRAWKYGRKLAKQLDIRLGKWFDEAKSECLKAYK